MRFSIIFSEFNYFKYAIQISIVFLKVFVIFYVSDYTTQKSRHRVTQPIQVRVHNASAVVAFGRWIEAEEGFEAGAKVIKYGFKFCQISCQAPKAAHGQAVARGGRGEVKGDNAQVMVMV
ncbi:hypothetical protein, conserved [Babesia bigemina]|uniref:Uncharacterized protein n=1 Tax=Babesia bigemina TaxID=5866 RepID=A0A061BIY3_BABBI|nr:hypothetical protein, conserved [Babesia bigemina]CDR71439.1 hypothetical protein, conserved [Babesia bigemina]|eukprot:XP_012770388.1 hypothetical protein, conserved [Babesia bigemina]